MTIKKVIGASTLALGLLAASTMPSLAATTVSITGNGAFSDNAARVSNSSSTSVNQSNVSNISNSVSTNQSTGGNTASFNTGGSTAIVTGNATSDVAITNEGGVNIATLAGCESCNGDTSVEISGNGAFSSNNVAVRNMTREEYRQYLQNYIRNMVRSHQSTGNNSASFNTSNNATITTGDADSSTTISNTGGTNILQ